MEKLPLRIRYGEKPLRGAAAWLVPGNGPRAWLAELLQWQTPLSDVRLYIVPCSSADLSPRGVLAVPPDGCRPSVSRRCQPYGRMGRHGDGSSGPTLYLPVEARLDPDAAESEIVERLGGSANVYLWHPAVGLIGFEPDDARQVVDLLAAPAPAKSAWDRAEPGIAFSRRLTAIEPDVTVSIEQFFQDERGEIGSQASALEQLPPTPDEPPTELLARMADAIKRGGKGLVRRLRGKSGKEESDPERRGKSGPDSINKGPRKQQQGTPSTIGRMATGAAAGLAAGLLRLGSWLRGRHRSDRPVQGRPPPRRSRHDEKLLEKRQREVERLLHALETNPDEGLRYALPYNWGRRDAATPGSQLVHHSTDFDLQRLGGGWPADIWHSLPQHQHRLWQKYHELASRELRLGRHRRAAYIYAELLGNLGMAASALTAGRHWREAAVLYRDRLNQPDQAAKCLEQGGLWTEAIALYEELGRHEKVGDLYRQLDQPEEAARAYRSAVAKLLTQGDFLAAARLLETKLGAPDEAIAQLESGWSSSTQGGKCLEETFQLLARLGRHEAALAKVAQLRQQTLPPSRGVLVVETLSRTATTYPNDGVDEAAADATRVLAATRLREAAGEDKRRLVEAVRSLVPADRLLGRDCERYLRPPAPPPKPEGKAVPPKRESPRRTAPVPSPELVREIRLSRGEVAWQTAASAGDGVFYAAGYENDQIVVEQGFWDGTHRRLKGGVWPERAAPHRPILLAPAPPGDRVIICVLGGPRLPAQAFPAADQLPARVRVGTPAWIHPATVAIQRTSDGTVHAVEMQDGGLVLSTFDYQNQPLGSRVLGWQEICPEGVIPEPGVPIPFHARREGMYLAVGSALAIVKPDRKLILTDLPGRALSLEGSRPFSRPRLVAALEQGAVLYWDEERLATFATDLANPVVRFTLGGWLVAASAAQCQVYRTEDHRVRLEASCRGCGAEPLAVLEAADPNQFALFGEDGVVRLYQIPR